MLILIGGEKGGTGKTTLAVNLAALRAHAGRDVLLVDTDRQGSASFWTATRDEAGIQPRVASVQKFGKGLAADLRDLAGRYDDVIIDAGGRDSVELRAAMVAVERLYVPIQASQFDVWTLARMSELVEQAQGINVGLEAFVLINRASPNPVVSETADAQEALKDFPNLDLCETVIRDRIAFRKAASAGRAVSELEPKDHKADNELSLLHDEVFHA